MFFAYLIVDQNFAVLTVAARFMLGSPDDREDILGLLEDGIHFLKGAVGGFWVEEEDDGEDEGVTIIKVSVLR